LAATPSYAVEYFCKVERKFNAERQYTVQEIEKWKFSARLEEIGNKAFVSRCSYVPSVNNLTCDRYEIDKFVFDQNVNLKKFYVFSSQYDFQLFANLNFIENNGRGDIAYGKCQLVSP
jgi:hypothetical protein